MVTSGLVRRLQGHGLESLVEIETTDRKIAPREFIGAYGAGRGANLGAPGGPGANMLLSELRFYTNDAWPLIRGVAEERAVPLLLMDRYSRGALYVLNVPDNPGDLYALPQAVLGAIRGYLQGELPVRLDAPSHVSLFVYDNGAFIVQSFRSEAVSVELIVNGAHAQLRDLVSASRLEPSDEASHSGSGAVARPTGEGSASDGATARSVFRVRLPPHSYRVFSLR